MFFNFCSNAKASFRDDFVVLQIIFHGLYGAVDLS